MLIVASGPWDYQGDQSPAAGPVPHIPVYRVTVEESGLLPSTNWSASINGSKTLRTDAPAISFLMPNGTYPLRVTSNGYSVQMRPGGYVTVQGGPVIVAVTFSAIRPDCGSTAFLEQFCTHINHVVFVMLENHAYDNYFGSYCLVAGTYCDGVANGAPPGTCIPQADYNGTGYPAGSCPLGEVNLWSYTTQNLSTFDPAHTLDSTIGSMCGTTIDPSCLLNSTNDSGFWTYEVHQYTTFGQYNGSTIPVYWDLAEEYALGDNIYSSDPSYSLPNHWFMIAGQAPPIAQTGFGPPKEHTYLNQANVTSTIQDRLNLSGVTWKYYDAALPSYSVAIAASGTNTTYGYGMAYGYWNPMAGRNESYTAWYNSHFVNRSQFFCDAAQSLQVMPGCQSTAALPNISWVIPDPGYSDHPPSNITHGEEFVAQVVNAIENSSYWNSTAIFVSWDDYGGFYDHVVPPTESWVTNPYGRLSFRVPFIVISPYTPPHRIVHEVGGFDSVLALMEDRWGLGCVVPGVTQDCGAPLPTAFFDFNLTARPACLFPSTLVGVDTAVYPLVACLSPSPATALTPAEWGGSTDGLTPTEID
jgi:phospholipase C